MLQILKRVRAKNLNFAIHHFIKSQSIKSYTTDQTVTVHFITRDDEKITCQAQVGQHVLEVAHENGIDLEGACEASLACSTCHVYVEDGYFDKIPEPLDEEEDMLDLALDLRDNSRLGCQIYLTKELDNITLRLPKCHINRMNLK